MRDMEHIPVKGKTVLVVDDLGPTLEVTPEGRHRLWKDSAVNRQMFAEGRMNPKDAAAWRELNNIGAKPH